MLGRIAPTLLNLLMASSPELISPMVPLQVTDPGCGNSSYPKILNFSCGSLVISPCQLILFYFTAPFVFRFFLSQVWIGAQEESILQLDIIKQIDANDDSSTWIRHYAGSTHGGLFVVTCLILWKHRNARIFNNVVWENWFIISQIWNLQSIIRKFFVPKPSHVHDISARWIPPTSNFIKLNTDGSSLGNPDNVVFGCLLCDSLGQWISSYLGSCEIATCLFAELIAIYHGINIAWNKGIRNLYCESDSKNFIQGLKVKTQKITHFIQFARPQFVTHTHVQKKSLSQGIFVERLPLCIAK